MSPTPYTVHLKIQLQTFTDFSVNVSAYHTVLEVEYCYMTLNAVMEILRELDSYYVGSTTNTDGRIRLGGRIVDYNELC